MERKSQTKEGMAVSSVQGKVRLPTIKQKKNLFVFWGSKFLSAPSLTRQWKANGAEVQKHYLSADLIGKQVW